MNNKENEQMEDILKKSAKEIEMKPFAERWKDIEDRLEFDRGNKTVVKEKVPVLAVQGTTAENFNRKFISNKNKIIVLSICLFLIIVLAIIIPICLRKSEPVYFAPNDLVHSFVSEEEFYENVKNSEINLVDLNGYNCENFTLLISTSGEVQGGKVNIYDEERLSIVYVSFYSDSVIISDNDFDKAEEYKINDTEILYKLIDDSSELIEYQVFAKHNNVTYELKYFTFYNNVIEFFNEFFS